MTAQNYWVEAYHKAGVIQKLLEGAVWKQGDFSRYPHQAGRITSMSEGYAVQFRAQEDAPNIVFMARIEKHWDREVALKLWRQIQR